MTIGIVVYSRTGHTLSLAKRLEERFSTLGRPARLEKIETVGSVNPSATHVRLKTKPRIEPYEALLLGSPVNGGRMAAPMASYFDQIPTLDGKRVACFVTHFFIPAWGANQTLSQMKDICEAKGATVVGSASVRWFSLRRGRQIRRALDRLSGAL